MKHWFTTPNYHIGGTPKEVMKSLSGLVRVMQYLDGMRGLQRAKGDYAPCCEGS